MIDQHAEQLISARWVVPVVPQRTVLDNHSVVIRGEQIVAVLPISEARQAFPHAAETELTDHVLMPGLINAHGHGAMSLFRGIADDLPLMTWLNEHIWPVEAAHVSDAFVRDGTLLAIAEMIMSGTTCFSDMYFFPDVAAKVAQDHHIRAQITFPVLDFPTVWATDADEYIHKGIEVHAHYRNSDFVQVGFGPHAPYTVSDAPLKNIVTLAEQLQAPIQIHLHETAFEVQDAVDKGQPRPISRLADLGLLSPMTQCVHMTALNDEDIEQVTAFGAHVVHCPESNLKLASGICPVDRLIQSGVNVCLGTDGAASNNDLDLFGEMRTAAMIGKIAADNAAAVDAWTALEMATINGAVAMGLEDKIGSLEAGKWADMIAVDLSALSMQPVYSPVSQLVYSAAGQQVSHSWIGGTLVMDNRQLTMIDTVHLKSRINDWAGKIRGQ